MRWETMMDLFKYQSLGNDYFVLDAAAYPSPPSAATLQKLCDRHLGFGSDGLLYGPCTTPDGLAVRIFNPDGSEAEKSGNGLRIFARYLYDTKRLIAETPTSIQTLGGPVSVTLLNEGQTVTVGMGKAQFLSTHIPMTGPEREVLLEPITIKGQAYTFSTISIGNPHCTLFLDTPADEAYMKELGPILENHPLFPKRTNVQLAYVNNPSNITIEIWERGAGYTLASGSSASAVAALAVRLGYTKNDLTVHMPGGRLKVEVEDDFSITQTGPVAFIGTCNYPNLH